MTPETLNQQILQKWTEVREYLLSAIVSYTAYQ